MFSQIQYLVWYLFATLGLPWADDPEGLKSATAADEGGGRIDPYG